LRFAARSGVHMGRFFANQAPNKESHPIHRTQELPGSAISLQGAINWRDVLLACDRLFLRFDLTYRFVA
jgi:hypothetical protein